MQGFWKIARGRCGFIPQGAWCAFSTRSWLISRSLMVCLIWKSRAWHSTEAAPFHRNCPRLGPIRVGPLHRCRKNDGLVEESIAQLLPSSGGELWILGDRGALCRYASGRFQYQPISNAPRTANFERMFEDHHGALWMIEYHGSLARVFNWRMTPWADPSEPLGGASPPVSTKMLKLSLPRIKTGGSNGWRIPTSTAIRTFSVEDGLASDSPLTLYFDKDQTLWIGSKGGGLTRFRNGNFTAYTTADGLYSDYIYQILEDSRQNLWMSTNEGIFRVSKSELNAFERGTAADSYQSPMVRKMACWPRRALGECNPVDGWAAMANYRFC